MENRKIVYSSVNKNYKIEISGARFLNKSYPDNNSERPIMLFKKVSDEIFEYIILMKGDPGYEELNARLMKVKNLNLRIVGNTTM